MGESAEDPTSNDTDFGPIAPFDRANLHADYLRDADSHIRLYHASSLTNPTHDPEALSDDAAFQIVCGCLRQCGSKLDVYEPGRYTRPGSSHSPQDVYLIDEGAAASADLIVLHVNSPSHGVGEESQIATDAAVPRIILRHEDARLSAMCEGLFSTGHWSQHYRDLQDFERHFAEQAPEILKRVLVSKKRRLGAFDRIERSRLGLQIWSWRLIRGLSLVDLSALADLAPHWIHAIERDDRRASLLTLLQLTRIGATLGCAIRAETDSSGAHQLKFVPHEPIDAGLVDAARQFVTDSRQLPLPYNEHELGELTKRWMAWVRLLYDGGSLTVMPPVAAAPAPATAFEGRLPVCLSIPISYLTSDQQQACEAVRREIRGAFTDLASEFDLYDPAEKNPPKDPDWVRQEWATDVYLQEHRQLRQAAAVVVVDGPPAFGVGIGDRIATDSTVCRLRLATTGTRLSRMFAGSPTRELCRLDVSDIGSLRRQLAAELRRALPELRRSAGLREAARQRVWNSRFGQRLRVERLLSERMARRPRGGTTGAGSQHLFNELATMETVSDETDLRREWIEEIENNADAASCVTLLHLYRLSDACGCRLGVIDGIPVLAPPGRLERNEGTARIRSVEEIESCDNLRTVIAERDANGGGNSCESASVVWRRYERNVAPVLRGAVPIWDKARWRAELTKPGDLWERAE